MTTTKHSPGPWTVDRNMIETESGEIIAQVSYKQDGYVKANARLMAAAPAMLEALKSIIATLAQTAIFPADVELIRTNAAEAIAQATQEGGTI